jgi:hypothetical protein
VTGYRFGEGGGKGRGSLADVKHCGAGNSNTCRLEAKGRTVVGVQGQPLADRISPVFVS